MTFVCSHRFSLSIHSTRVTRQSIEWDHGSLPFWMPKCWYDIDSRFISILSGWKASYFRVEPTFQITALCFVALFSLAKASFQKPDCPCWPQVASLAREEKEWETWQRLNNWPGSPANPLWRWGPWSWSAIEQKTLTTSATALFNQHA